MSAPRRPGRRALRTAADAAVIGTREYCAVNDNPSACADRPTPTAAAPITVSLVLGSGGARGLAHIGVIQWLTENGYQIRAISGASIGALV
ncbi:MAG: patatin-like phospholipase family protein, partial [Proteobacteria bacterium]|nr:patatin-like phospholipase family protein [Pseudomonadota bacterium]